MQTPSPINNTKTFTRTSQKSTSFSGTFKTDGLTNDLSVITDWYIPEDKPSKTLTYPGPNTLTEDLIPFSTELLARSMKACYNYDDKGALLEIIPDYRVEYKGMFFRGHRQRTIDGILHILRVTAKAVPELKRLGLPTAIQSILCHPYLGHAGGLVIFSGQPGHGKSTSCAAVIMERVKRFGSFCLTVEEPPEYPLNGDYNAAGGRFGKIIQVHSKNGAFASDLRDALRCYPSNSMGSMLLVGEIRDADSAMQVIQAANNGQLVFMTMHAGDPIMAVERLMSMANAAMSDAQEVNNLLASCLRAVIHQRLVNGKLMVKHLFSMDAASSVAQSVRKGNCRNLSNDLNIQEVKLDIKELERYVLGVHANMGVL